MNWNLWPRLSRSGLLDMLLQMPLRDWEPYRSLSPIRRYSDSVDLGWAQECAFYQTTPTIPLSILDLGISAWRATEMFYSGEKYNQSPALGRQLPLGRRILSLGEPTLPRVHFLVSYQLLSSGNADEKFPEAS